MARIGLKGLTYAKVTGGGDGSAMQYTGGVAKTGLMRRAEVTVEREDVSQYGDDVRQEHANGVTGTSIALELTRADDAMKADLLGYVAGSGSTGELTVVDAESPYVGFGYITSEVANGVKSFVGYWHYKVQFGMDADSAETKGENTAFQSVNLTGKGMGVQLSSGAASAFYITKSASTEAAIRTWLNGMAGISGG